MPRMTMIVDAHSLTWAPVESDLADLPALPPTVKLLMTVDTEVEANEDGQVTTFFDTEGVDIQILKGDTWEG
jgi:hypothetical protein